MKTVICLAVLALSSVAHAGETVFDVYTPWRYRLGTSEASSPDPSAWRAIGFDDSTWTEGPSPIGYTVDLFPTGLEGQIRTSLPTGVQSNYTSVYFRRSFVVFTNVSSLKLTLHVDDGAVAWLNGVEIARINVPAGQLPYNAQAQIAEEVRVQNVSIPVGTPLVHGGINVLAVQGFNALSTSSDFVFAASLEAIHDTAPQVVGASPALGAQVNSLGTVEVFFDEAVTGVNASDLLLNGVPATNVVTYAPNDYVFYFAQPAAGHVEVSFALDHAIADTDGAPTPFGGMNWSYMLDTNVSMNVRLSEFLADNSANIEDEDGDNTDWIEIYNPGPGIANLDGWHLTDDSSWPDKWTFPSGVILDANTYLLVWASGKDRTSDVRRLHTNFRLERSGEYLGLLTPSLEVVSEFAPAQQYTDRSYGRDRFSPSLIGYYMVPTPGGPNTMTGPGFTEAPVFSMASGVFTENSITVTLTGPGNADIRYTLDGSEPLETSPKYTNTFTFSTNIVVKARAFSPALWPSPIVARTYHFLDTNAQNFSSDLPIVILNTMGRTIPQNIPPGGNRLRGSFVVIDTFRGRSTMQTAPQFQGLAQFEIYGQTAAGFMKQPYRVEVNDELGNDMDVSLLGFPPEADFQLEVKMQDKSLLNGFLSHELHHQMGHYTSRRRFVEVFRDTSGGKVTYPGDYIGVYEFVEKIERDRERVDIAELTPSHTTEPEITGGYIFKKDKDSIGDRNFTIPGANGFSAQLLKIHEPKPPFITTTQLLYLSNYVHAFSRSLFASDWLQLTGTNHYSHYIDVDSWVDQHWIVEYTKNIDGYRLSRFWSKDRGGKIVDSPIWDFDLCFGNANYLECGRTNGWYWNIQQEGMDSNNHPWHRRLLYGLPNVIGVGGANAAPSAVMNSGDPEFIQKIIDRWGELRTNVFANERVLARVDELAAFLSEAAQRNYTKYPVLTMPLWPNPDGTGNWNVNFASQPTYAAIISELKKWITGRFNWLDAQFVRAPALGHPGGLIASQAQVVINAPAGIIYCTTNGTDPRAAGGAVSPSAFVYSGAITIVDNGTVFARARVGSNHYSWSPPAIAHYYSRIPRLRITEIMYHPTQAGLEYIVVQNTDDRPLNLKQFQLTGGVEFAFPSITLPGGERAFVVENAAAFVAQYGSGHIIAGEYLGNLDNAGERLVLTGPRQEPILDFAYDDTWYPITDGLGFSLVIVDSEAPRSTWGDPVSWRPSGAQNLPRVVVNELLSNPQDGAVDTVELHNPSGDAADVSGWYLTDDLDRLNYRIPTGTVIPAGGYIVLTEANFNFGLAQEGEEIFLLSANPDGSLSGYLTGFAFGGQRTGVSFGRYFNGVGQEHFVAQQQQTFGAPNVGPAIPDVVISEIMYRPPEVFVNGAYWDNTEDEFVELHNRSGAPVNLTRRLLKGAGIHYQFAFVVLGPDARLLVVSFNPLSNGAQLAHFRAKFGVPESTQIVGPYTGSLANGGGSLDLGTLLNYGTGDFEALLERVDYGGGTPWPSAGDGVGLSIHRVASAQYGNDPINWSAGPGSPGSGFAPGPAPVITAHPQSQTIVAAETATVTFSVSVAEPTVRYQWRKDLENINGATNSSLTFSAVESSDAGIYQVIVWNQSGYAISSNAVLTVLIGIHIDQQPQSVSVRIPGNARFSVFASSPRPISYQWRFNGVPIPGANMSELALNNITEDDEGLYDVLMTDSVGSVLSTAAQLTVLAPPVMVSPVPPLNLTSVAGDLLTVSARLQGTLPIFARWRWTGAEGGTFTLGDQILHDRVASFSFPVPAGIGGRVLVSLTNLIGGSMTVSGTPTNAFVTVLSDTDGDRMPDAYERANGLDENDANDANADADGDTMTNRDEYIAGTDPQNAASYLKVERLETSSSATISFSAVSNRTYSVQYTDALNPTAWQKLQDLFARPTNYSAVVTDPASVPERFYRLVTPAVSD